MASWWCSPRVARSRSFSVGARSRARSSVWLEAASSRRSAAPFFVAGYRSSKRLRLDAQPPPLRQPPHSAQHSPLLPRRTRLFFLRRPTEPMETRRFSRARRPSASGTVQREDEASVAGLRPETNLMVVERSQGRGDGPYAKGREERQIGRTLTRHGKAGR